MTSDVSDTSGTSGPPGAPATSDGIGIIDAHHHLWDLGAVAYPWLMAKGEPRFFGDPSPIQRDYLLPEFRAEASAHGVAGSIHIQVGAADPMAEAVWVDAVARANPDWPMAQVVFCDLTAPDREAQLDAFQSLTSVRGARQIVGRAPGEDAATGTNALLDDARFAEGLRALAPRGLSFDLQLIPELMAQTATVLAQAPETAVALCHAGSPHDRSPQGLRDWAAALKGLSTLHNVTAKLSGLGMFDHGWTPDSLAPIVAEVLAQFGPERTMWGSNFPVCSLSSDYTRLFETMQALVPDEMHRAVFHQTAADFYGLSV